MKFGILKPIFFALIAVMLGIFFIEQGNTSKLNKFYSEEVKDYANDPRYPIVLLDGISDQFDHTPIYSISKQADDAYAFDLNVYQYVSNKTKSMLFSISDAKAYENGSEINTFKINAQIHIKHANHEIVKVLNFSPDKANVSPYFVIHLNDNGDFVSNIDNQNSINFSQIYSITFEVTNSNDQKLGESTKLIHDENINVPSTHQDYADNVNTISFNGLGISYKNANLNLTDADSTLVNKYNGVFITYVIIYVVIILLLGTVMFLKDKVITLFHKLFNRNKKSVSGTIETK